MRHTTTYSAWCQMHSRCKNEKNISHVYYGPFGITVCARWSKFENFLADMGERPKGMSLDRKDSKGNYSPENCRWATPTQQARNRKSNRAVTINGETRCIAEWAELTGIKAGTLHWRHKNWGPDRMLADWIQADTP